MSNVATNATKTTNTIKNNIGTNKLQPGDTITKNDIPMTAIAEKIQNTWQTNDTHLHNILHI